jgi:cell division septation protein DedD
MQYFSLSTLLASKISHSASTSVVRGSQPGLGYIALKINITMTPLTTSHEEYLNYYVKDIGFQITTPQQNGTSSTASSSPSSSTTVPVGVVAGATIGAVALIALLVIVFLLLKRRRQRKNADRSSLTEPVKHVDPLPHEEEGPTPVPWVAPDSAQPAAPVGMMERNNRPNISGFREYSSSKSPRTFLNSSPDPAATTSGSGTRGREISPNSGDTPRLTSTHSTSLFSSTPSDPPPTYGPEDLLRQDRAPSSLFSPELARFAAANRDVINENLEARLQAAGYLPTDDPNRLTAEEWRVEYGITKLELRRLQDLYSRLVGVISLQCGIFRLISW